MENIYIHIIYFIFSGRYVARTIRFCTCETEVVTLLQYKLWPSSPLRSNCAISTELLDFFIALQCQAHVSLNGFLNSLIWLDDHPSHEKVHNHCFNYCVVVFGYLNGNSWPFLLIVIFHRSLAQLFSRFENLF